MKMRNRLAWFFVNKLIRFVSKEDRNEILTVLVKRLFNTIEADDILREKNGQWICEGKVISENEKKLLIVEAKQLLNMKLWNVLQNDIKYQANRKMYLHAEDVMQLTAGKLWLYNLDAIKTRLKSISEESGIFNKS